MAQMVARRIGNAEVTGSIPVASFFSILHYINIIADMAELADAPDLGSGGYPVQVQVLSSALSLKDKKLWIGWIHSFLAFSCRHLL